MALNQNFTKHLEQSLGELRSAGLYKEERVITSPQSGEIEVSTGDRVLNFCSNNYLGLADNPELIEVAKNALDQYGFGMASARFICGTQEEHKVLETNIANFLKVEDAVLYSSGFDANTGLFETLLNKEDAIISDSLNHASIIDGIRLCKARRYRYLNNDMEDLEAKLQKASGARYRMIATDGVFSMDGIIANLKGVCELAEKYDAIVMVDDSHAVGLIGKNGRGSIEKCGVEGRVDIITGTLGKALGGASGGYTASSRRIVKWLRQRSRPYLFSNTLAPVIVSASIRALELIKKGDSLRKKLRENTKLFRKEMSDLGFKLVAGEHPIIPIILGEANIAQDMAAKLLKEGIYVIGFSFPVVPEGKARIRVQISASHSQQDIFQVINSFNKVGCEIGVV